MELAGFDVDAVSVGGLETCIHLPRQKVAFDIGRCPPGVVRCPTILFTHAHMDHMGGAAYHCATRALRNMAPPTYLVPHENAEDFEDLFDVWRRLDRSDLAHTTVPIGPGESYELRPGLVARPFRALHTAPCQGYALHSVRRKLRPEYAGRSRAELQKLRVDDGVDITAPVEVPEVAFVGDTLIEVLEREEVCRKARLLILEVTFYDDRVSVEECRAKGHVHLDEVAERAELFENEAVLLTHASARYKPREVREAIDAKLPPGLRERVTPLWNGRR
jgi:ribonuclease Z